MKPSLKNKRHRALIDACQKTLAASLPNLQKHGEHAREMELQALAMQKRLRRMLPGLQSAADSAPQDSKERRDYLRAREQLMRCEQAFQMAKKQRLMAEQMVGGDQ